MLEFFQKLFSTDFMPHSYCLRVSSLIGLHAASDGVTALAYFLIPLSLVYLARRRKGSTYRWIFLLFGAFIFSCGTTHLLSIWTLWHPMYRLDGLVKAVTAITSLGTAILLIRLTPQVVAIPTPTQLRDVIEQLTTEAEQRVQAEEKIRALNEQLRKRVAERDAALAAAGRKAERQEQVLADTESNVQFLLDLLPALVCYIDAGGYYRRVNRGYEQWFGRPLEQIQGRSMEELLGAEYVRSVGPYVSAALRGETVRFEATIEYPVGLRTVDIAYRPDIDKQGGVQGFAALITDISERKRLEQERHRHAALLDQAMEPLFIWELHGVIEYWNRAAEELYGYSAAEAIGRVSHVLLQTVHPQGGAAEFESVLESEASWSGELRHTTRDDRHITVASRHRVVTEASGRRLVLESNRDITARKQMEMELRLLNETLEAKVRERTQRLNEANRELEAFSYSVSHDLRAPLRSVDGFGRILLRDYPRRVLDDRGVHYIERMGAATVRMGQLIDDLLNLSQVSRTALRRQIIDLNAMANEVWREICSENPARCVDMSIECNAQAYGDFRLLRIVMQNLLGNAWKFTGKAEKPRVAFGCDVRDGETTYFVRDNGVGFDMAHAEQLFAPFQRVHTGKEFEGSGIGLAIVQRIIQRHGGRVWAEGEKFRGATFFFTLGDKQNGQVDSAG